MKKVLIFLGLIVSVLSCNTTEPPPLETTIALALEDIASIEVWIKLTTTNLQFPTTVTLKKNNTVTQDIFLSNADTVIYIDSLLPNQQYTFQAITQSSNLSITSNELSVTTMDTTSHNFTWQTFTFGEHSTSVLNDVAIIDENNIWAVGEIYLNDSLGQPDPQPYAVARWNGTDWALLKVPYHDFNQTVKHPGPLFSIAVISGEIYVVSYANLLKWIGNEWVEKAFFMEQIPFDGQVLKMWGSDQNNIYCVGRSGAIYYYFGSGWQSIESGTDVDIQDIWGITNGTSEPLILCAASNAIEPGEHKILKITGSSTIDSIEWISNKRVHSVWMKSSNKLFACGDGVFINNLVDGWKEQSEITFVFTERVRGVGENDVFVVGDFGLIAHFNGASWKEYPEASTALVYTSLDYRNNLMVTVGYTQSQAVIQFMIRN